MDITSDSIETQIPYYLTREAKEGLVKALNEFPHSTNYYTTLYPEEILQGDGWNKLEILNFENGDRKEIKGILFSNSCDISPENKRDLNVKVTFAPVIKLTSYVQKLFNEGIDKVKIDSKVESIKSQKISSLFYLPRGAALGEDYIALLDDVHTMPFKAFESKSNRNKQFTLSQVGFYLFLLKLSVHFCRFHEDIPRDPAA